MELAPLRMGPKHPYRPGESDSSRDIWSYGSLDKNNIHYSNANQQYNNNGNGC